MFELSKEHEDFRTVVREFAEAEVAPHIAQWDRDHHFPADLVPKMGELGLFGLVVPEEFGGGATATSPRLCVAIEELGRVDQSIGITLSRGRRPRHQPDPHLRQRGAEGALPARPRGRPRARGLRPDRARRRLRRRRHPHQGRPRRRRVGRQRRQGVHHQLRHRHHLGRHRHRPHRHQRRRLGRRSARSWSPPARRASPSSRPTTSSAGTPPTPTASPSTTAASRPSNLLGEEGAGLQAVPQDPRRRPHRHLRARRRLRAGLPRASHRLRQDPQGLRPADRRQPGRLLPARRPRRHGRGRPRRSPTRRRGSRTSSTPAGARSRRSSRPPRSPSSTRPRRPSPRPASPRRSSAATASWRSTPSPGSTATPRSSRSARAPPRCSAWSSPATSACRARERRVREAMPVTSTESHEPAAPVAVGPDAGSDPR